ncbi:hypothetical protein LINPERHAP1_LOCUS8249 [Linum perenne]
MSVSPNKWEKEKTQQQKTPELFPRLHIASSFFFFSSSPAKQKNTTQKQL